MVILLEKMKVGDGSGEVERGARIVVPVNCYSKWGEKRMDGLVRIILGLNLRD
jgi:hypothetical protein